MAEEEKVVAKKTTSTAKKSTTSTAAKKTTSSSTAAKKTTSSTAAKKTTSSTTAKKTTAKKAEAPVADAPSAEAPKAAAPKAVKAPKAKKAPKAVVYSNRLQQKYADEVKPALMAKYNYKSVMQVPALNKVVINVGVGEATSNSKAIDDVVKDITLIAGQKPVVTKAKKSIASFKLREGQAIGCKVTLRGVRMYEFLDKLFNISLPRVRDFRGVSKNAFDGRGDYTLGIKEQLIFPEIDYDKVTKIRGMDIVIVTTAKKDEEAYTLLELLGMPFKK